MKIELTKQEYTKVLLAPKTNYRRQPMIKEAITYRGNGVYEVSNDLLLDERAKRELEQIIGRKVVFPGQKAPRRDFEW